MRRYIISFHAGLDGVRVSLVGNWGNIPFANSDEAENFIAEDSKGVPFKIEREVHRAPRKIGVIAYE